MLKKFSEFIAEGMWGSALRRSNTDELRKEEIVHLDIPIKEWVKQCIRGGLLKDQKIYVDRERSKKMGFKCYKVNFVSSQVIFPDNIPIEVTVDSISNFNKNLYVSVKNMNTLERLPDVIEDAHLIIDCDKFNNHIKLPKCKQLEVFGNISNLPKRIECDLWLREPSKQLGHIEYVGGDLYCCNSYITSLVGLPKEVGGDVDVHNNKITDLIGAPEKVGGDFHCSCIGGLKSLKGCPKYIGGNFSFFSTGIEEIDDFPDEVGGNVELSGCCHLKSFKGLPNKINGDLDIAYCNVESLKGLPTDVNGYVYYKSLTLNNEPVSVSDIIEMYPELSKHLKTSQYSW